MMLKNGNINTQLEVDLCRLSIWKHSLVGGKLRIMNADGSETCIPRDCNSPDYPDPNRTQWEALVR